MQLNINTDHLTDEQRTLLDTLMDSAPFYWEAEANERETLDLMAVEDVLIGISTQFAMLSAYLHMRSGGGNGDQGHAKAVSHANSVNRQVRKALGYQTTPKLTF